MAWYDFVLDRTGALGSLIKHQAAYRKRDDVINALITKAPPPLETKLILEDGTIVRFDCELDVGHEWPVEVTEYPVEDGATISDHIVNKNASFSVTGIFSNTRLRKPDAKGNATVTGPTQKEAYDLMQKIKDDKKVFSLLTPLGTYSNIVISNMGMPRDTGDALKVVLSLKQIRRTKTSLTTVTLIGGSATTKTPKPEIKPATVPAVDQGSVNTDNSQNTTLRNTGTSLIDLLKGVGSLNGFGG